MQQGLGDEREIAQLRLAAAGQLGIDALPQGGQRPGIAFFHEGERHDVRMALHHALRDALAQASQRPHLVLRQRLHARRCLHRRPRHLVLRMREHVRFHHPALRPGALEGTEIDAHLARHPAGHRSGEHLVPVAVSPGLGAGLGTVG